VVPSPGVWFGSSDEAPSNRSTPPSTLFTLYSSVSAFLGEGTIFYPPLSLCSANIPSTLFDEEVNSFLVSLCTYTGGFESGGSLPTSWFVERLSPSFLPLSSMPYNATGLKFFPFFPLCRQEQPPRVAEPPQSPLFPRCVRGPLPPFVFFFFPSPCCSSSPLY